MKYKKIEIQPGDLLFQDTGDSELSLAIKRVTPPYKSLHFDHVGIVIIEHSSGDLKIAEALPEGIC